MFPRSATPVLTIVSSSIGRRLKIKLSLLRSIKLYSIKEKDTNNDLSFSFRYYLLLFFFYSSSCIPDTESWSALPKYLLLIYITDGKLRNKLYHNALHTICWKSLQFVLGKKLKFSNSWYLKFWVTPIKFDMDNYNI